MQESSFELAFLIFILQNFNEITERNELDAYHIFQKSIDFISEVCIIKISETWKNSNYYIKK